jgi:hypothetical protein
LFRVTEEITRRQELLIVMTPHVINNDLDAKRVKDAEVKRANWILESTSDIHNDLLAELPSDGELIDSKKTLDPEYQLGSSVNDTTVQRPISSSQLSPDSVESMSTDVVDDQVQVSHINSRTGKATQIPQQNIDGNLSQQPSLSPRSAWFDRPWRHVAQDNDPNDKQVEQPGMMSRILGKFW